MERIDLTMDNEFSSSKLDIVENRLQEISSRNSIFPEFMRDMIPYSVSSSKNGLGLISNEKPKHYVNLSNDEVKTNFVLGSIDYINSCQSQLKMYRSMDGYELICDCCGVQLDVFNRTPFALCVECNREL